MIYFCLIYQCNSLLHQEGFLISLNHKVRLQQRGMLHCRGFLPQKVIKETETSRNLWVNSASKFTNSS